MEIPLRTAYSQAGRCGMQPKAKHSLRAQAQLMRTETVETFELVKVKQKLLDIRAELERERRTREYGLAIHPNDHQARRRFVEWAQNEIAVVPYFHKRILFSDEAHFWLNGYVNKQNCRIWSEANPQVYVETPLHLEKLTGTLYGLMESLVRTSSKTMKATTLQSMVIGTEP
ncbi:hypothetical protein TNCV_3740671 [Trichonephila clavipes]|nr:hypothetical protein TNCV_3740671 [Trichonephila clavipes]